MIMIRGGESKMALSFETSLGLFHGTADGAAEAAQAGSAGAAASACAQPAPFLTKTYELVDDPATNHIVSWNEDDTSFVVWRPPEFAKDILPKYFKHNNFSSFIRQLNTYGFRKVVPERWEFANDYFRRGETHLLCEIHRRKPSSHAAYNRSSPPTSAADVAQSEDQHHLHQLTWLQTMPSNSADSNIQGAAHVNMGANNHFSHSYNNYGCTNAVYNLGGPDRSTSSEMSGGSSRHVDQSGRASLHDSAASAVVSDENERLRRDNTLLLYELSRLRHLCRSAVLAFQQRAAANPVMPPAFPPANRIPPPVTATPLSHLFAQQANRPALLPPSEHVSAVPAATSARTPRVNQYADVDEGYVSLRRHASMSNVGLLYADSNDRPARLLSHNNCSTPNIISLDDCKSILQRPAADRLQQCEQAGVVKLFGVPLSTVDHNITNLEGSTSTSTSSKPSSF